VSADDDDEVTEIHTALEQSASIRAQLAAARDADDGSAAARTRHIDAAIAMIVALVDELDDEQADSELAALIALVAHDRELEIATRRTLAAELVAINAHDRAAELGEMPQRQLRIAKPRTGDTPIVAAHFELALAAEGDDAEAHCRAAVEHARRASDVALLHETTRALAELLAAREALVEAEALLEDLPPLDDARETRALLEEIWRRLGSHLEDDADEPDEPGEMDRQLRAYITKPRNVPQALVDGGLVSPDRIREWSYGELREPADLESQRIFGPVRSFWCACGRYRGRAYAGIICRRCGVEVIHAASRRMRAGHITLAQPVVHPWYAPAAALLLGKAIDDVDALRAALDDIDLEWIADDIKREIVTAPKARIADQAGKRLALVEAFRTARTQAYTRPTHVILELVPVAPPHGDLGCDREKVRAAYAQLLESADTNAAVHALFDAFSAR
jgi:hypothetical protein